MRIMVDTNDKDFLESDIERPEVISHLEFWYRYLK